MLIVAGDDTGKGARNQNDNIQWCNSINQLAHARH